VRSSRRRDREEKREPRNRGRRIVVSVKGVGGHGKTDFYLTGPKPILVLSTDPNTRDVIEKVFKMPVEEIDPAVLRFIDIPYPLVGFESREDDVMDEARESWNTLTDAISDVLHERLDPMPKLVALDTGTELDTLNTLKEFGRTDRISPQVRRIRMGAVNNDMKGIFRALERSGVHVAVTHRVRERWETVTDETRGKNYGQEKDQVVPGKFDRIGFKQIENIVNTEVIVKFDPEREGKLSARFGMEIERCMIRPALVGKSYWGKDEGVRCASFPYLATKLYPQTDLDEWL
jgi:hypothetical protein